MTRRGMDRYGDKERRKQRRRNYLDKDTRDSKKIKILKDKNNTRTRTRTDPNSNTFFDTDGTEGED